MFVHSNLNIGFGDGICTISRVIGKTVALQLLVGCVNLLPSIVSGTGKLLRQYTIILHNTSESWKAIIDEFQRYQPCTGFNRGYAGSLTPHEEKQVELIDGAMHCKVGCDLHQVWNGTVWHRIRKRPCCNQASIWLLIFQTMA